MWPKISQSDAKKDLKVGKSFYNSKVDRQTRQMYEVNEWKVDRQKQERQEDENHCFYPPMLDKNRDYRGNKILSIWFILPYTCTSVNS